MIKLKVGDKAPDFEAETDKNEKSSFERIKGLVTLCYTFTQRIIPLVVQKKHVHLEIIWND